MRTQVPGYAVFSVPKGFLLTCPTCFQLWAASTSTGSPVTQRLAGDAPGKPVREKARESADCCPVTGVQHKRRRLPGVTVTVLSAGSAAGAASHTLSSSGGHPPGEAEPEATSQGSCSLASAFQGCLSGSLAIPSPRTGPWSVERRSTRPGGLACWAVTPTHQ